MNKTVKQYFKQINSHLLCSREEKEKMLLGLKLDVENYLEENPTASMEEIKARFGTPESIADSYRFSADEEKFKGQISYKKKIAFLIGGIFVAIGLTVIIGFAIYYAKLTADVPEYYVTEEKVYQYISPEELAEIESNDNTVFG